MSESLNPSQGDDRHTVRDFVFRGMDGCSNHGCLIRPPVGMGTNGICQCLVNASRSRLVIIQNRLAAIADAELK